VQGVSVTLAFQGSGAVNPTAVTDAGGHYVIQQVPVGTYAKLTVQGKGYSASRRATVGSGGGTANFTGIPKDWAARNAGAAIQQSRTTGIQFTGCNAKQAIDLDQGTAEVTNAAKGSSQAAVSSVSPKHFVVRLPRAITVTGFAVDPAAGCGVGASAATGAYKIEVSPDGSSWFDQSSGAASFGPTDVGKLNALAPTDPSHVANVRYVRFTIEGNQVAAYGGGCPSSGLYGCTYASVSEVEVFGHQ
jgi:hypothetical protein